MKLHEEFKLYETMWEDHSLLNEGTSYDNPYLDQAILLMQK